MESTTKVIRKASKTLVTFNGVRWCSECLKTLHPDEVWIPDSKSDNRNLCFRCAPGNAVRFKDLS